jgi:leucyl/phenylalanyl-tRNA--protein transferase
MHWYCPAERCVLPVDAVSISHSMRSLLRRNTLRYTMDTSFMAVIEACREGVRESNTWIHDEIVEAYGELHRRGLAHSLEVWEDKELVGGLYGVSLGALFFGESMFSRRSNASKAALVALCRFLPQMGIELVDCQVPNDHLMSMGAKSMSRDMFLDTLQSALEKNTNAGNWKREFAQFMDAGINKWIE